MQLIFLCN